MLILFLSFVVRHILYLFDNKMNLIRVLSSI